MLRNQKERKMKNKEMRGLPAICANEVSNGVLCGHYLFKPKGENKYCPQCKYVQQKKTIQAMKEQIEDIGDSDYRSLQRLQFLQFTLIKQKQELQTLNRVIQKRNKRIDKLLVREKELTGYIEKNCDIIDSKNDLIRELTKDSFKDGEGTPQENFFLKDQEVS